LLNLALKRSAPILTPADWIAQLPDDRDGVKQLIINRCVNCHGPVNFVSRRFDRLGWKKVVIDMGRIEEIGPPNYESISDEEALAAKSEEAERITAYLTKHFGPDRAPGLNVPKAAAYRNTAGEPDVVITQFDIPTRTAIPTTSLWIREATSGSWSDTGKRSAVSIRRPVSSRSSRFRPRWRARTGSSPTTVGSSGGARAAAIIWGAWILGPAR